MAAKAQHRSVFARHSWENNFYLERIHQLAGNTIVEVFADGPIDSMLTAARAKAELAERIALISSTLGLRRHRTQRLLAITGHRRFGFDLAISPGFEYLRSSARSETSPRGVPIDAAFVRRFERCGFALLLQVASSSHAMAGRLLQSIYWLSESRQEPAAAAAVIKTAIGLESLLIANETESLRGPLAERSAFLLSGDPAIRERVARSVRRFYDVRSGIVHGGRKKGTTVHPSLLDGIDRLVVLLTVMLATNANEYLSFDKLVAWVDGQKWGAKTEPIRRPFPASHLTRAIQLAEQA